MCFVFFIELASLFGIVSLKRKRYRVNLIGYKNKLRTNTMSVRIQCAPYAHEMRTKLTFATNPPKLLHNS